MTMTRLKYTNVDALSRNPMGQATNDDEFNEKIQDIRIIQADTPKTEKKIFAIETGEDSDWFGFRR